MHLIKRRKINRVGIKNICHNGGKNIIYHEEQELSALLEQRKKKKMRIRQTEKLDRKKERRVIYKL